MEGPPQEFFEALEKYPDLEKAKSLLTGEDAYSKSLLALILTRMSEDNDAQVAEMLPTIDTSGNDIAMMLCFMTHEYRLEMTKAKNLLFKRFGKPEVQAEAEVPEAPVAEAEVSEVSEVSEAPVAEAEVSEAPVAEAEVSEAPVAKAEVSEAPVAKAEAPVAEAAKPSAPAPEAAKPSAPAPEAAKPSAPAPEAAKPSAPDPEAAKPSAPSPETPEAAKPSAPDPEAAKAAKAVSQKGGSKKKRPSKLRKTKKSSKLQRP